MNVPRRHHLVPAFYLRRFADADGWVYACRRSTGTGFRAKVKNVSVETDFYTAEDEAGQNSAEVEEALSQVEGLAAAAISRISHGTFPPSTDDRLSLSLFMALQFTRTRAIRHVSEAIADATFKAKFKIDYGVESKDDLRERLRQSSGSEPSDAEVEHILDFLSRPDKYLVVPHQNEFLRQMLTTSAEVIAPILAAREWSLIVGPERRYITSDQPIVLWASEETTQGGRMGVGIGNADEVYFPLDPYRMLVLEKQRSVNLEVLPSTHESASIFNTLAAARSYEWVYHHPDDNLLAGIEIPPTRPLMRVNGTDVDRRNVSTTVLDAIFGAHNGSSH